MKTIFSVSAFFSVIFYSFFTKYKELPKVLKALMKGFDPNDDQSVADTDFVGNAIYAMVETQKRRSSLLMD
jgi:hypothetical protein